MSSPEILSKLNIGSGLNNTDIVTAIVESETIAQKEAIDRDEAEFTNQISAFGLLQSQLTDFRTTVRTLEETNASTHIGSSSSSTTATFEATGVTDNDDINSSLIVNSLAKAHSLVSGTVSSTGALVGAGTLTIDFGTWSTSSSTNDTFSASSSKTSFTVNTSSSTTLSQLRDSINNAVSDSDGDGENDLSASILYNGTNYVLVLKANQGAANGIRVTPSDASSSTLSNVFQYTTTTKNLTQTSAPADASFSVDGISMTRSNNTITDLYQGYTLNLLATNSSAITISASENSGTIEALVQEFVDAYNTLYVNASALSQPGYTGDTSGPLASDSSVFRILRGLRELSTTSITGYKGGPYSLSLLGVQTQRDGTLFLRKDTLKNTLSVNSNIINAVFKDTNDTDNSSVALTGYSKDTAYGTYALTKSSGNYILNGDSTLSQSGSTYTSSSGDTNGMALTITDTSVESANIYFGESLLSKIDTQLSQYLKFNGDIRNRVNNLNRNLSEITERRQQYDSLVASLTERYTRQFANMEGAVAGLKETGDMISQMLEKPE